MAVSYSLYNSKNCVEKKNALLGPALQFSGPKFCFRILSFDFLKDISQARRRRYISIYGECQSVCLVESMIGILSENNYLDLSR